MTKKKEAKCFLKNEMGFFFYELKKEWLANLIKNCLGLDGSSGNSLLSTLLGETLVTEELSIQLIKKICEQSNSL
jgi:hypothetical protein